MFIRTLIRPDGRNYVQAKEYLTVIARFITICIVTAGLLTALTHYGARQTVVRASDTQYPLTIQTSGFPFAVRTHIAATSSTTGNQRSTTLFDRNNLYMNALIWFGLSGIIGGTVIILRAQQP